MRKKAFTMLELVMVIVVMGIVASIGADIIANLYENYIRTRAINRLQAQSELVLDQIAQRLQYRIKDSVIARDVIAPFSVPASVPLPDANSSYTVIEWIGSSNESFLGGWSGFIDLDSNETNSSTTPKTLKTSGSDLNATNNIILALTNNNVSLDAGSDNPALIFKGKSHYDINDYYNATTTNHTLVIRRNNNNTFEIRADDNVTNNEIFEQYYLSHSAFAIVPEGSDVNDFNLTLRYNYQPWEGEDYNITATSSILMEHVSTFRFTQIGETIRIKLCVNESVNRSDYNFAFCKERVIY